MSRNRLPAEALPLMRSRLEGVQWLNKMKHSKRHKCAIDPEAG